MENNIFISRVSFNKSDEIHYFCDLPFYKELSNGKELNFESPVTFFVGENGSGKSTLMEAIAVSFGFNPEGGTINFSFSTKDTHSTLSELTILGRKGYPKDGFFLRAESFYNAVSYIDTVYKFERELKADTPYGSLSLHEQSHGESFLSLVSNRFGENGLYLLDEPEAALSPTRQLSLMSEINRLVGLGSQFIIATHSPLLLAFPGAKIYSLDAGINELHYEETEHFKVTKGFLESPERYLSKLLE